MTIRMVKNSLFGKIAKQAGQNKQAGRKYFSDFLPSDNFLPVFYSVLLDQQFYQINYFLWSFPPCSFIRFQKKLPPCLFIPTCLFIIFSKNVSLLAYSGLLLYQGLPSNRNRKMICCNFSNFCRKKFPGLTKEIFCTY